MHEQIDTGGLGKIYAVDIELKLKTAHKKNINYFRRTRGHNLQRRLQKVAVTFVCRPEITARAIFFGLCIHYIIICIQLKIFSIMRVVHKIVLVHTNTQVCANDRFKAVKKIFSINITFNKKREPSYLKTFK